MTPEQKHAELQAKARAKLAASGIDAPVRSSSPSHTTPTNPMRTTNILLSVILVLMLSCIGWFTWKWWAFKAAVQRIAPPAATSLEKTSSEIDQLVSEFEAKRASESARLRKKMAEQ